MESTIIFLENPGSTPGLEAQGADLWLFLPGSRHSSGRSWTTLLSPKFLFFTSDILTQGWGRKLASRCSFPDHRGLETCSGSQPLTLLPAQSLKTSSLQVYLRLTSRGLRSFNSHLLHYLKSSLLLVPGNFPFLFVCILK